MKPVLSILSCLLIFSGASFANSHAKEFNTPVKGYSKGSAAALARVNVLAGVGTAAGVNEKLLQTFKKTFPDAQEVQWQELSDKYMVNFKAGGLVTTIEYDKDGEFISSLRYYSESNLPVNILCKLHKKYPEKKVFGVTEKTTPSNVEYLIKLEDATTWMTVSSNNEGDMSVVEKYKKAE